MQMRAPRTVLVRRSAWLRAPMACRFRRRPRSTPRRASFVGYALGHVRRRRRFVVARTSRPVSISSIIHSDRCANGRSQQPMHTHTMPSAVARIALPPALGTDARLVACPTTRAHWSAKSNAGRERSACAKSLRRPATLTQTCEKSCEPPKSRTAARRERARLCRIFGRFVDQH